VGQNLDNVNFRITNNNIIRLINKNGNVGGNSLHPPLSGGKQLMFSSNIINGNEESKKSTTPLPMCKFTNQAAIEFRYLITK
jgi:hypothetical protein